MAKQTFKTGDGPGEARDVHRAPSLRGPPGGARGVPGGTAGGAAGGASGSAQGVHCTTGSAGDLGPGALVPESDGKTGTPVYPLVIFIISTIRWQKIVRVYPPFSDSLARTVVVLNMI